MKKQNNTTSIKTKKKGKPGKLLSNQFSGYNDYVNSPKGRVNTFVPMEQATIFVDSAEPVNGGGGNITIDYPNFDDPQPVFIDPVITDPVGLRGEITSDGNTVYTPPTVYVTSEIPAETPIDMSDPIVVDTDDEPDGSPAQLSDENSIAEGEPSPATSKKSLLIIILVIIAIIICYYLYKKYK